jgi:hypothetical protein
MTDGSSVFTTILLDPAYLTRPTSLTLKIDQRKPRSRGVSVVLAYDVGKKTSFPAVSFVKSCP